VWTVIAEKESEQESPKENWSEESKEEVIILEKPNSPAAVTRVKLAVTAADCICATNSKRVLR
jgi:hypothetical protein